jgi:hypothetical protein
MLVLLVASVAAQAPTYGPCNATFPYSDWIAQGKNISFPIIKVVATPGLVLNGTIQILDSCTFAVNSFLYLGGGESYWYGGFKGSDVGIRIADEYVYASQVPNTRQFKLTSVPGAQANFGGFNQIRLFDRNTNVLVATADMPDPKSGTPGGSSGSGTSGSTGGNSTKNSGFGLVLDSLVVVLCSAMY